VKTEDGHLIATAIEESDARLLAEADAMFELLKDIKDFVSKHQISMGTGRGPDAIERLLMRAETGNTTARMI
jgi:hypothetical protein